MLGGDAVDLLAVEDIYDEVGAWLPPGLDLSPKARFRRDLAPINVSLPHQRRFWEPLKLNI